MKTKSEEVKYADVNFQDKVPELVLRTEDIFDSDDDGVECETENSENDEDMELDRGEEFETDTGNPGWAEAMSKILNTKTPEGKESVVLAKAKKISDLKIKKDNADFEVATEVKTDPDISEREKSENERRRRAKRREWILRGRLKPCILEKNRERILAKIATKGVVQLFNSVRGHQISLNKKLSEAGTTRKREKVISSINKRSFLEMLSGSKTQGSTSDSGRKETTEVKDEDDKTWKVLRDDFMLGANMKDWDKDPETKLPMEMNAVKEKETSDGTDGDVSDSDA